MHVANLDAGRLTSFGFAVEAPFGQQCVRYLIGRRIHGSTAVTCLFVLRPEKLAGTYVWISEDLSDALCDVQTYVPTMKQSVRLVERYVFDCLPLTDIGYLDLMAWRYPGLGTVTEDITVDLSWSRWPSAEPRCYLGPSSAPGLTVTEAVDSETGIVVARVVARQREIFRRWEIVEMGDPEMVGLPERIRVSRRETGSWTEYHRVGSPIPLPEEAFEGPALRLKEVLEAGLPA
jgi:hypothetical protein